jgi:hypothetical protein
MVHPNPSNNTVGVVFKSNLQNMSVTRSMYVSLQRADARLQGRVHPNPEHRDEVIIVPATSEFALSSAAVPDIDVSKEITGRLEVVIHYGPSPDDLRYVLEYEIEPRLDIRELTEKGAQLLFTGPLKKYRHRRL